MATDPLTPQTESDLDYGPTLRGLREGLKVFGRYTLVRMLGRGGMGVVWLARDDKLDLDIALKFLPDNLVGDESALADLRHETRRCMKLHHTHIVHVYDLVDDEATAAIAMEFVDGRPLSALRAEKAARVMDVADVLPLLRQTCEALTYAHETAKIVHHDLKPANLMLTKDGILKVMDFGIASSLSDSLSKHSRVGQPTGNGGGTLPYMSPQQIMGYPPSVVDDVYALGATLYELLTGKPPFFRGDLTRQIESITPPTISQRRTELGIEGAAPVPEAWEQVIAACLEKDAEKRPQNVRAVWEHLNGAPVPSSAASVAVGQSFSGSVAAKAQNGSVGTSARTTSSRKPILLTLVCVAVIALALMTVPRQKEKEPKVPPQTVATGTAEAARLAQEKADAEAARLAKEKANEEEKQKQMAVQAEHERLLKEAEMKTQPESEFDTGKIGDTRVVDLGGVKLTLCYCPPGTFMMGSPPTEEGRTADEDQAQTTISRGFWLAKTECTQAQWKSIMDDTPFSRVYYLGYEPPDPPVEVTWTDAQNFIVRLNEKHPLPSGWEWQLPSEAQWEYACRAGTTASFAGLFEKMTDHKDSFGREMYNENKVPNAWGLYDMHGSVFEWCRDLWDGRAKLPGGTDPLVLSGPSHVLRGGSNRSVSPLDCRSAARFWMIPLNHYGNPGFRVAAVSVRAVATLEEKHKHMAAQLERERLLKEAEMKKQAASNDFNTAQIGDTRVVDLGSGVKLTLCYCPAGSFTMGSPLSETDQFSNKDQMQVRISRGYWLAKTECTQAQWLAVMGADPSGFKGDDLPVEQVSWEDAQEFVVKLNGKNVLPAGWKWSLPTEAQWEYACRAGTTTPYAGELERMAWYNDNSGSTTHAVGTKAANAWGLQDMHGNVHEWCSDWFGEKLPGGTDPTGASSGSSRVNRGGSWVDVGRNCRSASRSRGDPCNRYCILGFRVASVPVKAE